MKTEVFDRNGNVTATITGPTVVSFSRAEVLERAREWMATNCPRETRKSRNEWYVRLGLMVDFLTDQFPE